MPGSNKVSPEVRRIVEAIELLLVRRRIKRRDFERRIKLSAGSLSRMLSGKGVLKVDTLFEMLKVLEVSPLAFFNSVFSEDEPTEGADELYRKVQSLALPEPSQPVVISKAEIKEAVAEALSQFVNVDPDSAGGFEPKRKPRAKRRPPREDT